MANVLTAQGRIPKGHLKQSFQHILYSPWKINMEPENDGLEDDFPFQLGDF